jgi:hypothetical protein
MSLCYTSNYKHSNYICQGSNNKMSNNLSVKIAPDFEKRYPDSSGKATECAMNLVLTADLLEKRIASLLLPFDLSPARSWSRHSGGLWDAKTSEPVGCVGPRRSCDSAASS